MSSYWSGRPGLLERSASGAFALFVPETTFFGAMPDLLTRASAAFEATYTVNPDAVQTGDVAGIAARVRELPRQLAALGGAQVESDLPQAIEGAADLPGFDIPALALRFGQIAAAAGLLVFGAASLLAARRASLRASLRLAGASRTQIAALEILATLPAALLGLLAGAPLAALTIAVLGRLEGFEALGGGFAMTAQRDLPWAAAGAIAVLVIGLAASALAGRRAAGRGVWLAAAALGGGVLFWALTRQETLFEAGETRYALLLAPLALLAPAALLAWLLVPRIARPLAWLASIGPGITLIGGLRAVARHPAGVVFPLVLLAAAAAVLLATLPGTLERSPVDRAAHAAGGDVRASGLAGLAGAGEGERRAAIAGAGLDAASPLVREAGVLDREGSPLAVEVLGIDPASFGAAANVRPDLTADPLTAVLSTLNANSTALEGHPVPANSRQIGAWVRLTDTSGEVRIALSLRNERGRYVQLLLGVADADPDGGPWLFHAADLATPLDIDGAPIPAADLAGRLTLHGFYLLLGEDAAAAPGSALLGPVLTSLEAPAAPRDRIDRLSSARESFEQREVVHSLADLAGLEPIDGLAAGGASVGARDTYSSAPGFRGAQHLDWSAATEGSGSSMRGLRQATDGAPALVYASRAVVDRLALAPGEEITLTVRERTLRAQIAGELAGFPTFPADAAFVVTGLDRLLAAVNASPHRDPLATNEAWFASYRARTGRRLAPRPTVRGRNRHRPRVESRSARQGADCGARLAHGAHVRLRRAARGGVRGRPAGPRDAQRGARTRAGRHRGDGRLARRPARRGRHRDGDPARSRRRDRRRRGRPARSLAARHPRAGHGRDADRAAAPAPGGEWPALARGGRARAGRRCDRRRRGATVSGARRVAAGCRRRARRGGLRWPQRNRPQTWASRATSSAAASRSRPRTAAASPCAISHSRSSGARCGRCSVPPQRARAHCCR